MVRVLGYDSTDFLDMVVVISYPFNRDVFKVTVCCMTGKTKSIIISSSCNRNRITQTVFLFNFFYYMMCIFIMDIMASTIADRSHRLVHLVNLSVRNFIIYSEM